MKSLFSVLKYNQNKVDENLARVISGNRIVSDVVNINENVIRQVMFSFEDYLSANRNTTKPILHISLNPSPEDRLTDGQFAGLAQDYMERMGYGDQPCIVYMHEDTGRRHIHIITTCVDEHGRKIGDSFEWKRSMEACRELELKYGLVNSADRTRTLAEPRLKKVDYEKGDVKRQISGTLKGVLSAYKFQSFGEYSALLACFNIEAKQVRGEHDGEPYTGVVYSVTDDKGKVISQPFKSSLLGKQFGHDGLTRKMSRHAADYKNGKWGPGIHDTVRLTMITCRGDRANFEKVMHGKGIDAVFRQNEQGRIYGATFIDHNSREVYNGSRLGKEFSANSFEKLFNDPSHRLLNEQPQAARSGESIIEEMFGGIDVSGYAPPEPYEDDLVQKKKRKKKKRRHTVN